MLRLRPGENWALDDHVPDSLADNVIMIGWARAPGLLDPALNRQDFRPLIAKFYPQHSTGTLGAGAGNMWRFVREMEVGDLVVVPDGASLFVAQVTGPPTWMEDKVEADTAYRRPVIWLNDKRPTPRSKASSLLQTRLGNMRTCLNISDLLGDVQALLRP